MERELKEIGYDSSKLPLGKISANVISAAYRVLKQIEEALGEVSYKEKKPEYYLAKPIENFWKNTTDVTLQHDQD